MRQLYIITTLAVLLCPTIAAAQSKAKYTISGTIKDKSTGETLIGASVSFLQPRGIGVATNAYGFYSISMPEGRYTVIASYTGYKVDTIQVDLHKDVSINIGMKTSESQLKEVVVSAQHQADNITKTPAGVQKLSIEEIKNVPVLFGEKDVLKTIQLLPGIKSAGDGKSGFFVRGGTSDQNMILLDEATVYNASHLLGFFSVFNSDAIKDISVYKGGMPSVYGGRLSSVEDIIMKDGNNQKFGVSGGLGLISSRINVEGPIVKDEGSFVVSARRTYADLFLGLSHDTTVKNSSLYFYDINAKANYSLNKNNRIFLSGYFGKDVMSLKDKFGINWGNSTATLRWNHIFNSKLFSNTSLIYSNFNYNIVVLANNNNITINSKITDYHLKEDFNYYVNTKNKIDFGIDVIYHNISPGTVSASESSIINNLALQHKYAVESGAYASHEWSMSDKAKLTYGIRVSSFAVFGAGDFYTYDKNGATLDTTHYNSGQLVKNYINPEPRIAFSYQLNGRSSVKLSYDRNVQNIHLLDNSTSGTPTSLYIPSSNNVKPEIADQVAVGYYRQFHEGGFNFSTELYYKAMQNQIDYRNGAELRGNEQVESQLLYGSGRSYGWETYLQKNYGRFTGWLSYTLSRTEKKIAGINDGTYYPANQDQTHNISIVGMYKASTRWTVSATFVYNTGNAVSWPSGKFSVDGVPVFYYTSRNAYRMPAYHRLDLGATLEPKKKNKKFEGSWTFSLYNAYGHANPYLIQFQQDPKDPAKTQAQQVTLFKVVPSVTYNFKF
jgi:hypothetical protein